MILTGERIVEEVKNGRLIIDPFNISQVNPNSYDFRLGDEILTYRNHILDSKKNNPVVKTKILKSGLIIQPYKLYLACTEEIMGSNYFVPVIRGRSSTGRLGLFIHITAGLIDIGSINKWTLMFHSVQPVKIYPGMLIGQVTFWTVEGKIYLYKGKYQGSTKPEPSQSYKDFIN